MRLPTIDDGAFTDENLRALSNFENQLATIICFSLQYMKTSNQCFNIAFIAVAPSKRLKP
ncbi:hypothetical protein GPB2148_1934 [marine gamma proteobacterium HTCC2148]|nr:hypothetical protein GPB2148_1934 [marine gamma proteobacterium HTCC2148]